MSASLKELETLYAADIQTSNQVLTAQEREEDLRHLKRTLVKARNGDSQARERIDHGLHHHIWDALLRGFMQWRDVSVHDFTDEFVENYSRFALL